MPESAIDSTVRTCTDRVVENAGQDGSLVCEKVTEREGNLGYNALPDKYKDLVEAGVIDPAKVVCCEMQNAASVATPLLTGDVLVIDKPEKEENRTPDAMSMM